MKMGRKQQNPKLMLSTKPPNLVGALKSQGFDKNYAFMDVWRDHFLRVFIFPSVLVFWPGNMKFVPG